MCKPAFQHRLGFVGQVAFVQHGEDGVLFLCQLHPQRFHDVHGGVAHFFVPDADLQRDALQAFAADGAVPVFAHQVAQLV